VLRQLENQITSCPSDVGPCDAQVTILNKISKALGSPRIFSTKGDNVCTVEQWS
jgi:hypothetical protein